MSLSNSKNFLKEVKRHPESFYIIHYSCQNLNDDIDGLSPRITSIAINHYATEQTVSFSTHSIAEELHVPREKVKERFDDVEYELLRRFYIFVRDRRDKYWIHWNMRNLTYGFEHLEHRYKSLGGNDAPVIPVERRLNLNDLLADRYGSDYAKHKKLPSLMELNGGLHRDYLSGEEEPKAFENNEFIRMHKSTLCKTGFFSDVIRKMLNGDLHTSSRGIGVKLDKMFESRTAKASGFLGALATTVITLFSAIIWAASFF